MGTQLEAHLAHGFVKHLGDMKTYFLGEITSLKQANTALTQANATLTADVATLKQANTALTQTNATLTQANTTLTTDVATLKQAHAALTQSNTTLRAENERLSKRVGLIEEREEKRGEEIRERERAEKQRAEEPRRLALQFNHSDEPKTVNAKFTWDNCDASKVGIRWVCSVHSFGRSRMMSFCTVKTGVGQW